MKDSNARERLAINIRKELKKRDMTIKELADRCRLSQSYVSNLISLSIPKNPSMETLDAIADVFGIQVFELFL